MHKKSAHIIANQVEITCRTGEILGKDSDLEAEPGDHPGLMPLNINVSHVLI